MSCRPLEFNEVSEEHVTSIVRIEDYAKPETGMKQAAKIS